MTGEKDRFTTVEKLWKLDDETLSTPEHDQTKNRFIVGYWDVVVSFKTIVGMNTEFNPPIPIGFDVRYFIEVKPKIKSFGATLRQIKTYLTYDCLLFNRVFIFTPDLRFKDAFQSQGINVLECKIP